MAIVQWSCERFVDETFSKAPAPGGGGVAAMAGALGTALAGMVCNLTSGKKKYAAYEADIQRIIAEAESMKNELMALIDKDAENFIPLSRVYGMPSSTDEEKKLKQEKMQAALLVAIAAPIEIMKIAAGAVSLHEKLLEKGSTLAVSDVGCGVLCLKAAIQSAWLNVLINLRSITDEAYVKSVRDELVPLMEQSTGLCDEIYEKVTDKLS